MMGMKIKSFMLIMLSLLMGLAFASANVVTTGTNPVYTGMHQQINISVSNLTSPFTYNILVYNASGTLVTNALYSNSIASNSFYFTENSAWGTGNFVVNAIVSNSVASSSNTFDYVVDTYVNPSIKSLAPNVSLSNVSTTFLATVKQGSYPVNTITWQFGSTYFTNSAFNGTNYQTYKYTTAGTYSIIVQVCDTNHYCSSLTQAVYVGGKLHLSYWTVQNVTVYGTYLGTTKDGTFLYGLQAPNVEWVTLVFKPYNDTNRIATVTMNWGDGSPQLATAYTTSVSQDRYSHVWGSLQNPNQGNYTISATICDVIGDCNTSVVAQVRYQSSFAGNLSTLLFNTNPNAHPTTYLGGLGNWANGLVGEIIQIVFFGGISLGLAFLAYGWIKMKLGIHTYR